VSNGESFKWQEKCLVKRCYRK